MNAIQKKLIWEQYQIFLYDKAEKYERAPRVPAIPRNIFLKIQPCSRLHWQKGFVIIVGGNEHVIEYNEFHDVTLETSGIWIVPDLQGQLT